MKRLFSLIGILLLAVTMVQLPFAVATAADANLIANPSFETANGTVPAAWASDKWGTNTSSFIYENTGHASNHSATVKVSGYTSGDAKWYANPVAVAPSTSYTFSDWYKSTAPTAVDAVIVSTTGSTTYKWLGDVATSADWKQASFSFKTPANAKTITFYHYLSTNGTLTTDDYSLLGATQAPTPAPTPPTVQITGPANNATVKGTQTISASASDAKGIASVQFMVDGINYGAADTTAPYSVSWDTTKVTNGAHTLTAIAKNTANLSTTSSAITVTVANPTPPSVQITAPTANATISGDQVVSATAADAQSIASVQFKLDGNNLGAADTTAPYSINWDTKTAVNGTHKLTAVATNAANLTTTSTEVSVTVNNVTTPTTPPTTIPGNLIVNPSVEEMLNNQPTSWLDGSWGANTHSLTYETTGHTGNRSLKTTITSYTNGDAKWFFNPVTATPNATYSYSNWYKSNVATELDAMVTLADGTEQFYWVADVPASADWKQVTAQFTTPANTASLTIFQVISSVGYVQTDDFSLTAGTPTPPATAQFNRALVSLTFDDGWRSIYANGLPLLQKYSLPSTQYLLTETIDYPDYMTVQMMQAFKNQGSEIASHTVSHADLVKVSAAKLTQELTQSQTQLRQWFGTPGVANNFATPYGSYNSTVVNEIKKYYRSHRSTDVGFNGKNNFDIYNIKVQNITNTTTPADVQNWVNQAIANKTWLVLVYHEVATAPEDATYAVTPANLDTELNIVKQSGVTVKTVDQALDELVPQL